MLERVRSWSLAKLFVVVGIVSAVLALAVWVAVYMLLGERAVVFFLLFGR